MSFSRPLFLLSIVAVFAVAAIPGSAQASPHESFSWARKLPLEQRKTACIFYDRENKDDKIGAIHARMLQNLLGAFPIWRVKLEKAQAAEAVAMVKNDCQSVFYLGTHFSLDPAPGLIEEIAKAALRMPVVWFYYKMDRLTSRFASDDSLPDLGLSVGNILTMQEAATPEQPDGGFYRYFDYKNVRFEKNARWDLGQNRLAVNPEIIDIKLSAETPALVRSWATHSRDEKLKQPYIVEKKMGEGALWLVADSPFSFVDYGDRYFIFCDLLWDILKIEDAPEGPIGALVRFEDLTPKVPQPYIFWAADYLGREQVPYSVGVIPYFSDTTGRSGRGGSPVFKPADSYPGFKGTMRYLKARGADIVFHGVAHQVGATISGYDGVSGADYEFWLYPENEPLPQDSADWVLDRLSLGEAVFRRMGIEPLAWELPHYAASALDYKLFGQLFEWNYHRSLNFAFEVEKELRLKPKHRMFECLTPECRAERRKLANELRIDADHSAFGGQIIPFTVYEDAYGQAIIPETMGMVDYLMYPDDTWRPVSTVEDLLKRAKQMSVVRGSYASFFWHPLLLSEKLPYYQQNPEEQQRLEGGKGTLKMLINGLRDMGYEFKSISDCKLFPRSNCE